MACGTAQGPDSTHRSDEAPAREAYLNALEPLPGNPGRARLQLSAYVRKYPGSTYAPNAALKLAELAMLQDDSEDAERWLNWLVNEHPRSKQATPARLRLGELEAKSKNVEKARKTLSKLRFSKLSPGDRNKAYRLLAQLATDPVARLRWLSLWRRDTVVAASGRSPADAKIDRTVREASTEELERASEQLPPGEVAGRVALELASRAAATGDMERAREALDRAGRMDLSARDTARLEALRAQIALGGEAGRGTSPDMIPTFAKASSLPTPSVHGATGTIGVVLPLTGPFAAYAEESLRGVLLATGLFAPPGSPPSALSTMRLRVRDSRGDPQRAAQAVRELAADKDVVAIVGPLLSQPSEAAAAAAAQADVPLLALTARTSVAATRPQVFRLKTTPGDEVSHLVRYATTELGARRFAILYPEDGYGRGMRERFWKAVDQEGGFVVAVASYEPNSNDFKKPIQSLIGYTLLTDDEKKAIKERSQLLRRARRLPPEQASVVREVAPQILGPERDPLPPIVDFDVLFVPDGFQKIALVAPQLAFHEIVDVTLVGGSTWHDPELLEIERQHVADAVIASSFDPDSRFPFVAEFSRNFEETFGSKPDAYAAQAYDAANLVQVQLAAGADSRDAVRSGLLATRAYPGASGVLRFLPDGNAVKRPFLMKVKGRRFVSLD